MASTNRVQRGCLVTPGRCPVLLMRSGILRKGLPAQWQNSNFRQPVCRGKYLFLVIYLLQLDEVNSLFPDCCALRGTRQLCLLLRLSWDQMAVVHLRGDVVTPYIAVTFRHGVSLATSCVTDMTAALAPSGA